MKKFINLFIFSAIGFGVGFFAGERFGFMKKTKERLAEPLTEGTDDEKAERILHDEGYVSDLDQKISAETETEKYFADFEHPEEDEEESEDEGVIEYRKVGSSMVPKMQPEEQYFEIVDEEAWENETEFSRTELFYYEDDEVVCDEDEKRIEDPEELIGHSALETFGQNPMNPDDCVYIRNSWTETIYQVTRIHNAYGRVVLGIEEEYPIP